MGCGSTKQPSDPANETWAQMIPAASTGKVAHAGDMVVHDFEATEKGTCARPTPEEVSQIHRGHRDGRVLRKQTILKADHYPSCHNTKLQEKIEGAPNFRAPCEGIPVFGTAAPTRAGLRSSCARMAPRSQKIVWCSLRQEPCIYIHGRPFCVKERATPFKAMENGGVMSADVEQAEVVLKEEILAEATAFGNKIMVMDETAPSEGKLAAMGEPYYYWEEDIHGGTVHTPREVFELLRHEGVHSVTYHRVPITDEQAPHTKDFDAIVRYMRSGYNLSKDSVFAFNCALGRGRTTTGLSIACLVWRSLAGAQYNAAQWDISRIKTIEVNGEPNYSWGEYAAVRKLVTMLPEGVSRKAFVDAVIDKCSHMQNLRTDILPKKAIVDDMSAAPKKRDAALVTGKKYLERYMYLLLFNCYVCTTLDPHSAIYQAPNGSQAIEFKSWLIRQVPQLYAILDDLTLN